MKSSRKVEVITEHHLYTCIYPCLPVISIPLFYHELLMDGPYVFLGGKGIVTFFLSLFSHVVKLSPPPPPKHAMLHLRPEHFLFFCLTFFNSEIKTTSFHVFPITIIFHFFSWKNQKQTCCPSQIQKGAFLMSLVYTKWSYQWHKVSSHSSTSQMTLFISHNAYQLGGP